MIDFPNMLGCRYSSGYTWQFEWRTFRVETRKSFNCDRHRNDVEKWSKKYHAFRTCKKDNVRAKTLLRSYNVGTFIERNAVDILGHLQWKFKETRIILLVMVYFTKWPETMPILEYETSNVIVVAILIQN